MFRNGRVRIADVTDGTSNTVFIGEHHPIVSDKTWVGVVPGAMVCPQPRWPYGICESGGSLVNCHSGPAVGEDLMIHPPNNPIGDPDQMYAEHHGGCNILLGDGSVRFVSQFIHQPTWAALATRANGEVIGEW
jgi:prepilin-type processing-associated H-X9-DG protein